MRCLLLASVWLITCGQGPSLLSLISKRPLCVLHDSMAPAPEAELTETLLEAIQALRFEFDIKLFDVSWERDDNTLSWLSRTCGRCSDRLVIARAESLRSLMPSLETAWLPECVPPEVRSVLFLTDSIDGAEPSPCLRDGYCLLGDSLRRHLENIPRGQVSVGARSKGSNLFYDAIISLSTNATVLLKRLSQTLLAHGLEPWQLHTSDSRMLEADADLEMLFRHVLLKPTIPLGGLTLGPPKATPPAPWSSWQCHSAGMAEFADPDSGPRAGSKEFCLLERVSCCTGSEFTFHTSSVESPNLPPARFVSQGHPNISLDIRPSQVPYAVRDCHLRVPVAYLWGHGWEANPAHLLHDAVRPLNLAAHLPARDCNPVHGMMAWLHVRLRCVISGLSRAAALPALFRDGMERGTEESKRADRSHCVASAMEGIRISRRIPGDSVRSLPVHRRPHSASVAPASPRSVLALLPGVLR